METNLAHADDGSAHRCFGREAASGEKTARPRRRRRRPPPGFITVADVTQRSGAAPSTIYHQIETGGIRACRWRGIIVIAERDAEEFVSVRPLRADAAAIDAAGTEAPNG